MMHLIHYKYKNEIYCILNEITFVKKRFIMAKKSVLHSFLLATGSFISGVTLGLLLTPQSGRQNRAWISNHAVELSDWVERQRKITDRKGRLKLRHIRKNVHDGLKQNIPDLYEATEHIDLSEQELIHGR